MNDKIVVIAGPNASGKSALAVRIAKRWNGEVISADSRQVYRGLDIGTGKVPKDTHSPYRPRQAAYACQNVPHHLIDVASPRRTFTVARYRKMARAALKNILRRGKLPIIAGGTGLYIDALLGNVSFPEVPPDQKLRKQFEKKSTEKLFLALKEFDLRRANTIDRHNRRRLIRALEIVRTTGKPVPRLRRDSSPDDVLKIGIRLPDDILRTRIRTRLLARFKQGMIAEVKRLHERERVSWARLDALGLEYRWISRHLRGLLSKESMIEKLETEIWHYAKRQMTWFKRDRHIFWVGTPAEAERVVENFMKRARRAH